MAAQPRDAAVRVPATTANLGPGFDAFGAALSCHLWAAPRPHRRARVTTTAAAPAQAPDVAGLPDGDDNLVWRSLVAACDALGAPVPDVGLRVHTTIPLERGLGSSSAAIVAGVSLARALTGTTATELELLAVAAELEGHPDNVAPALLGGLVVCTTDAEGGLVVRRRAPAARLEPVVLIPPGRQSTAAARRVLPETLPREAVTTQAGRAGHVLGALLGAWPIAPAAAGDVLHEPPRLEVMPAAAELIARLRGAGLHAWLSGAGPAVTVAGGVGTAAACRRLVGEDVVVRALRWDRAGAVVCRADRCAWSAGPDCHGCPRAVLAGAAPDHRVADDAV